MQFDDDEVMPLFETLDSLVRTPAFSVEMETPIAAVRALLAEHRTPAVVVFNHEDAICGVVTRTDVLRATDHCVAHEAMSSFVLTLASSASISKAAALIGYEDVSFIVVTDRRGELRGLVSATDIARHFAILAGALRR
jgi:CBS-domain-containing membrane protein